MDFIMHDLIRLNYEIGWQIEGQKCRVDPPHLDFAKMPKEVTAVHVLMVSNLGSIDFGALRSCQHEGHPAANQAVHKFAYDGNVVMTRFSKDVFHTADLALEPGFC